MTDARKICYDRILPQDLRKPSRMVRPAGGLAPRALLPDIRKLWINGSTIQVRFMDGTPQQKEIARNQALWWTEHANLKFDFNDAADAEIRIRFDPSDGAWSYIGTDATSIPRDQPTINLGFLDGGTAAHEFGHAIGLGHEHQSPMGGLQWDEAAVMRDLMGPPNYWTPDEIRHNVLEKYAVNQYLHGTEFDPKSIMLYAFPPEWTLNHQGTNANDVLSEVDKAFIASARVYPSDNAGPVALEINSPPVQGKIGKPAEEDAYQFTVPKAGPYVVETGGPVDLVMKLFGPDSQTALVAEDDDSGVGLNAKIVAELSPGQYFLQVRHYNRQGGTGAYSISVKSLS